jgi:hypothetical protein
MVGYHLQGHHPGWPFDENGYPLGSDTNMCEIQVPESLLRKWFEEKLSSNCPDWTFEHWFHEESTADETDGLFTWLEDHGYYPEDIYLY